MGITITGADQIQRRFNHVGNEIKVSPKRLIKIVSEARNRIQKRTNKALDYNDVGFQALNPDYAEYKKSRGKKGIPDLHFEGHMLNAMQVEQKGDGADIYFNNETERKKAEAHHFGRRRMPVRKFFRLGDKITKYIFDEFRQPIKKAIG